MNLVENTRNKLKTVNKDRSNISWKSTTKGRADIVSSNFEQNLKCEHAYHKRITYHAGA